MGTSSARRAPTGPFWRAAKGAATRYLSPEGGGAVSAGEVAARYLAALGEGAADGSVLLAAFRLTRRVAQELGALEAQAASLGLAETLKAWGLEVPVGESGLAVAQALATMMAGPGGGLEAAVVRISLALVLTDWWRGLTGKPDPGAGVEPGGLASRFLAGALYLRLALDLGESLEAAAVDGNAFQKGLNGIRDLLTRAAAAASPSPAPESPASWRSLAGWTWATRFLEGLPAQLAARDIAEEPSSAA